MEWPEKNRPGFVAFHFDSREDGYGEGQPMDEAYFGFQEIEEFMRGILVHPGNFYGLIDQLNETLQFFVEKNLSIRTELLVKEKAGSMVLNTTLPRAIEIALGAGPSLANLDLAGFTFEPWSA